MSGDNKVVRVSDNVEGLLIKMQEFDGSVEFCTYCHIWVTVQEWNRHMHDRQGLEPIGNNPCKEVELPKLNKEEQAKVDELNRLARKSVNYFLAIPRE